MRCPSRTTLPAAISELPPIEAPESTIEPIPIRHSSSITQPWMTARWPTVTRAPTRAGWPSSTWITVPSWMLLSAATEIGAESPRSTLWNHTLERAPSVTSPTTTAPKATKQVGSRTTRDDPLRPRFMGRPRGRRRRESSDALRPASSRGHGPAIPGSNLPKETSASEPTAPELRRSRPAGRCDRPILGTAGLRPKACRRSGRSRCRGNARACEAPKAIRHRARGFGRPPTTASFRGPQHPAGRTPPPVARAPQARGRRPGAASRVLPPPLAWRASPPRGRSGHASAASAARRARPPESRAARLRARIRRPTPPPHACRRSAPGRRWSRTARERTAATRRPSRHAARRGTSPRRLSLEPPRSSLVPDAPQELAALRPGRVVLDAERRRPVHDADHASPLIGRDHQYLQWIRGGTEDPAHLGALLDGVEDVDGIGALEHQHEQVPGADLLRRPHGCPNQPGVVALGADQARPGRFAERQPEARARDRGHHDLGQVLDSLDEMSLPEDDVGIRGGLDRNRQDIHRPPPAFRLSSEAGPAAPPRPSDVASRPAARAPAAPPPSSGSAS